MLLLETKGTPREFRSDLLRIVRVFRNTSLDITHIVYWTVLVWELRGDKSVILLFGVIQHQVTMTEVKELFKSLVVDQILVVHLRLDRIGFREVVYETLHEVVHNETHIASVGVVID